MKIDERNCLTNVSKFLAEIEIDGKFVALFQYSRRKYFLVIEDDGCYEFSSRKAVDQFISKI